MSLVVSFSCHNKYEPKVSTKLFAKDIKRTLTNWSVALDLCLFATGKIEAVINREINLWDFIAGKLIAMEAGAIVTDFEGVPEKNNKNKIFLISNGTKIHKELLEVLK